MSLYDAVGDVKLAAEPAPAPRIEPETGVPISRKTASIRI